MQCNDLHTTACCGLSSTCKVFLKKAMTGWIAAERLQNPSQQMYRITAVSSILQNKLPVMPTSTGQSLWWASLSHRWHHRWPIGLLSACHWQPAHSTFESSAQPITAADKSKFGLYQLVYVHQLLGCRIAFISTHKYSKIFLHCNISAVVSQIQLKSSFDDQ